MKEWRLFSRDSSRSTRKKIKKDQIIFYQSLDHLVDKQVLVIKYHQRLAREIKAQSRTIEKYLESIEKKAYNLAEDFQTKHNTKTASEASQDYYLDQVLGYLKGNVKLKAVAPEIQGSAKSLNDELLQIKKNFADLITTRRS